MRSVATSPLWIIPEVHNKIIIVKRSIECTEAMRVLHLTSKSWYYEGLFLDMLCPDFVFPSNEDVTNAITVLSQSAIDVASWLELRASENLKKFDRVRRHNKRSLEI